MSLYSKEEYIPTSSLPIKDFNATEDLALSDEIDKDFVALENHVEAYNSITNITTSASFESFNFIDKNNHVLFNEYVTGLKRNLNVDLDGALAIESHLDTPHGLKHYQISLEGIISGIWNGIKKMFQKLGQAISEFFKRHFTRLGVIKKRLENLIETLGKTDKDIKELVLEKVPGKIATTFPYKGTVSESEITTSVQVALSIQEVINTINADANKVASASILDKDFVARIKGYIDLAKDAGDSKPEIGKIEKFRGDTKGFYKSDNYKENKRLGDIEKDAIKGKEKLEGGLNDASMGSEVDEEDGSAAAKKETSAYFLKIQDALEKITDKKLPGGKFIKSVTVDADKGIELVMDDDKDIPDAVSLGSKSSLLKLNKEILEVIVSMEKSTSEYGKVNDMIMKNVDTVDKLIKDLDRIAENPNAGKYKKKLQNQVKVRLNIMKTFFTNYNKLNKNFMALVLDVGEGVVVYSTVSLKHFG